MTDTHRQMTPADLEALNHPCPGCGEPITPGDTVYSAVHVTTGTYRHVHAECLPLIGSPTN